LPWPTIDLKSDLLLLSKAADKKLLDKVLEARDEERRELARWLRL
jgi:hypothetical protein